MDLISGSGCGAALCNTENRLGRELRPFIGIVGERTVG